MPSQELFFEVNPGSPDGPAPVVRIAEDKPRCFQALSVPIPRIVQGDQAGLRGFVKQLREEVRVACTEMGCQATVDISAASAQSYISLLKGEILCSWVSCPIDRPDGGGDDAGDREPRLPHPPTLAQVAALETPQD